MRHYYIGSTVVGQSEHQLLVLIRVLAIQKGCERSVVFVVSGQESEAVVGGEKSRPAVRVELESA